MAGEVKLEGGEEPIEAGAPMALQGPRAEVGAGGRRLLYAGVLFVSSAGGLILEIVAGRMIAPYVGMSLYTWTAVIAVVLAGFSIGHWVGGRLATRDDREARWQLAWLLGLAAVTTAACLPLIRLVSPLVLSAGLHPITAIVLLTSALFLLPSLFVGTLSPILTKLAVDALPRAPGQAIGQMFAVGAIGSIAGTLAAGYVLISWIGSVGSVLAVAAAYLTMALGFGCAARPAGRRAWGAAAALGLALAAALGGGARTQAFTSPCLVESDYYCIRVVDLTAEIGRPAAAMVLDHLGHGINDREDPLRLHSSYLALTDRLLTLRLGPPEDFTAFFIGGGANSLPRAWSARYPEARLLVSEIDPAVTAVARSALWDRVRGNVEVTHRDARRALAAMPEATAFDVIVGDAFHDISVPQHLTTLEFARLLESRLKPDGFYALNVVDGARRPLFLLASVRTLAEVFEQVEVWVDEDQLGGGRVTYLVVAGRLGSGRDRLAAVGPEGPRWRRWPAEDLQRRIAAAGVPLLTDDFAPVDRLMLPVLAEDP
ncbi:MAG: fused MFS/spermidine synthase [Kiloniellales bacterium]|nr:fused MFS/spermidine synthase [Kiloniellales bacterium]